jgi:hypothetical protein
MCGCASADGGENPRRGKVGCSWRGGSQHHWAEEDPFRREISDDGKKIAMLRPFVMVITVSA